MFLWPIRAHILFELFYKTICANDLHNYWLIPTWFTHTVSIACLLCLLKLPHLLVITIITMRIRKCPSLIFHANGYLTLNQFFLPITMATSLFTPLLHLLTYKLPIFPLGAWAATNSLPSFLLWAHFWIVPYVWCMAFISALSCLPPSFRSASLSLSFWCPMGGHNPL